MRLTFTSEIDVEQTIVSDDRYAEVLQLTLLPALPSSLPFHQQL